MMLYHNEPPNGNGKSQPNRNIMDDNTEIRENLAKYNGICILGDVKSLVSIYLEV